VRRIGFHPVFGVLKHDLRPGRFSGDLSAQERHGARAVHLDPRRRQRMQFKTAAELADFRHMVGVHPVVVGQEDRGDPVERAVRRVEEVAFAPVAGDSRTRPAEAAPVADDPALVAAQQHPAVRLHLAPEAGHVPVAAALFDIVVDEHGDDVDARFQVIGHFMQVDVTCAAVLVGAGAESDQPSVDEELVAAVCADPEIGFKFDRGTDELLAHQQKGFRVFQQRVLPDPLPLNLGRHSVSVHTPPPSSGRRPLGRRTLGCCIRFILPA